MLKPIEEAISLEDAKTAIADALRYERLMPALLEALAHPERTLSENAKAVGIRTSDYKRLLCTQPMRAILRTVVAPHVLANMTSLLESAIKNASKPEGFRERETLFAMAGLVEQSRLTERTVPKNSVEEVDAAKLQGVLLSIRDALRE